MSTSNSVYVIGNNYFNLLSLNDKGNVSQLTEWNSHNTAVSVTDINTTSTHTIFTDIHGAFWVSGYNGNGQCAVESDDKSINKVKQITYFKENNIKITRVCTSLGSRCMFWITASNKLYGNGQNTAYQLGLGHDKNTFTPTLIKTLHNIIDVQSAENYSIALCDDISDHIINYWSKQINIIIPYDIIKLLQSFCLITCVYTTGFRKIGKDETGIFTNTTWSIYDEQWRMMESLYDKKIIKIACGRKQSVFLDVDGNVWCNNERDNINITNMAPTYIPPLPSPLISIPSPPITPSPPIFPLPVPSFIPSAIPMINNINPMININMNQNLNGPPFPPPPNLNNLIMNPMMNGTNQNNMNNMNRMMPTNNPSFPSLSNLNSLSMNPMMNNINGMNASNPMINNMMNETNPNNMNNTNNQTVNSPQITVTQLPSFPSPPNLNNLSMNPMMNNINGMNGTNPMPNNINGTNPNNINNMNNMNNMNNITHPNYMNMTANPYQINQMNQMLGPSLTHQSQSMLMNQNVNNSSVTGNQLPSAPTPFLLPLSSNPSLQQNASQNTDNNNDNTNEQHSSQQRTTTITNNKSHSNPENNEFQLASFNMANDDDIPQQTGPNGIINNMSPMFMRNENINNPTMSTTNSLKVNNLPNNGSNNDNQSEQQSLQQHSNNDNINNNEALTNLYSGLPPLPSPLLPSPLSPSFQCLSSHKLVQIESPNMSPIDTPCTAFFKDRDDIKIIDIQCGYHHNLALDYKGYVYAWGSNQCYQCGSDDSFIRKPKIIKSLIGHFIVSIKCGANHCYAKSVDDKHFLWGSNKYNQCSLIDTHNDKIKDVNCINNIFEAITDGKKIKDVYLGNYNTIFIANNF